MFPTMSNLIMTISITSYFSPFFFLGIECIEMIRLDSVSENSVE